MKSNPTVRSWAAAANTQNKHALRPQSHGLEKEQDNENHRMPAAITTERMSIPFLSVHFPFAKFIFQVTNCVGVVRAFHFLTVLLLKIEKNSRGRGVSKPLESAALPAKPTAQRRDSL